MSKVLDAWPTLVSDASVTVDGQPDVAIPRLDARYDWLGWAFNPSTILANQTLDVALFGDGCFGHGHGAAPDVAGKIALATNTSACDYFDQAKAAQAANASALVVIAAESSPLTDMNCLGDECNDQAVGLPLTMVSHADGSRLAKALEAGEAVQMAFGTRTTAGTDFLISAAGRLHSCVGIHRVRRACCQSVSGSKPWLMPPVRYLGVIYPWLAYSW